MKIFDSNDSPLRIAYLAVLSTVVGASAQESKFGAAGWMQYGVITESSYNLNGVNLDGRPLMSSGAQIVLQTRFLKKLDILAGLGVGSGHAISGKLSSNGGYAPMGIGPYIAQANFSYAFLDGEAANLSLRGGLFAYDYAPESQNLGLYLLRGPVYPGLVLSGFETKHVLPVANMLGLQLHHQAGIFSHDLLLVVETEFFPFYDLSPAYVAGLHFGKAFRIGAGINFNHLVAVDDSLTNSFPYLYEDSVGYDSIAAAILYDTTKLSFAGTKVMANFSFDPKALFGGAGILGPEDLKIYGEVALLGLKNGKAYKELYGDVMHRMPMMAGFYFPAFNLLDHLALEVEWYGARFNDDLTGFNSHQPPPDIKPIPYQWSTTTNIKRDNWKWSVHGSKVMGGHIKASFQVANDHYRPGTFNGYGDNNPPGSDAITVTPKDWYWMTKIAYFF